MAQRVLQQPFGRFAFKRPSAILTPSKYVAPSTALVQTRFATIDHGKATKVPLEDSYDILVDQRLQRPVAPHLSIYKPQITWYGSMFHRITGLALSGPLYLFGIAYVAAPLFGASITSAGIAAGFAKWPVAAKVGTKLLLAWPFTYHSFNGIRHLVWDTGASITNKQVIITGWTVVGVSVASALGLAFLF